MGLKQTPLHPGLHASDPLRTLLPFENPSCVVTIWRSRYVSGVFNMQWGLGARIRRGKKRACSRGAESRPFGIHTDHRFGGDYSDESPWQVGVFSRR
jgi:hypothetical protein